VTVCPSIGGAHEATGAVRVFCSKRLIPDLQGHQDIEFRLDTLGDNQAQAVALLLKATLARCSQVKVRRRSLLGKLQHIPTVGLHTNS